MSGIARAYFFDRETGSELPEFNIRMEGHGAYVNDDKQTTDCVYGWTFDGKRVERRAQDFAKPVNVRLWWGPGPGNSELRRLEPRP